MTTTTDQEFIQDRRKTQGKYHEGSRYVWVQISAHGDVKDVWADDDLEELRTMIREDDKYLVQTSGGYDIFDIPFRCEGCGQEGEKSALKEESCEYYGEAGHYPTPDHRVCIRCGEQGYPRQIGAHECHV